MLGSRGHQDRHVRRNAIKVRNGDLWERGWRSVDSLSHVTCLKSLEGHRILKQQVQLVMTSPYRVDGQIRQTVTKAPLHGLPIKLPLIDALTKKPRLRLLLYVGFRFAVRHEFFEHYLRLSSVPA